MWLDSRKFIQEQSLKEVDEYVVINNELEKKYDEFKLEFSDAFYFPENDLLHFWYHKLMKRETHNCIEKFGNVYFKMSQRTVDDFYIWIKDTKTLLDKGESIVVKLVFLACYE